MFVFGISTSDQYLRAASRGPLNGGKISYGLLQIGENPTNEEICRFENISLVFRTSNGTRRTTFRQRMLDVDTTTLELLRQWYPQDAELLVQDRAASHCLTSAEWAKRLFLAFPSARVEASDRLLYVVQISLARGSAYILEPDGEPLQYLCPPFVIFLSHSKAYRFPLRRLIAARARRLFRQLGVSEQCTRSRVDRISCVHPEAISLCRRDSRFEIRLRSIFGHCSGIDVLRTMNILNRSYFSIERLAEGANAAFQTLKPGGLWIVGRTLDDHTNHVTFFRRTEKKWELIARIGKGSEIEELIA